MAKEDVIGDGFLQPKFRKYPEGNFDKFLSCFYETPFEKEKKILGGNFSIDFYSPDLKLACEYDGLQHYSVIQRTDSDKRKNKLMIDQGMKYMRWPYYFMPTKDVCKYKFGDYYSDKKFLTMLKSIFGISNEADMYGPGFHTTSDVPANFIWQGINKFLMELADGPESLRHQVRYSLKLECEARKDNNDEMIIPIYHDKFMEFFNEKDDESHLDFNYKRRPKND